MLFPLLLILGLSLACVVSGILAHKTYTNIKAGNGIAWAVFGSTVVFLITFAIILFTVGWLIAENVEFSR